MNKEKIEQNLVLKPGFPFSLWIIEVCELPEANKKFVSTSKRKNPISCFF